MRYHAGVCVISFSVCAIMHGHLLAGLVISRIGESLGVVEGECEDIGATVSIFEDQVNVMLEWIPWS